MNVLMYFPSLLMKWRFTDRIKKQMDAFLSVSLVVVVAVVVVYVVVYVVVVVVDCLTHCAGVL